MTDCEAVLPRMALGWGALPRESRESATKCALKDDEFVTFLGTNEFNFKFQSRDRLRTQNKNDFVDYVSLRDQGTISLICCDKYSEKVSYLRFVSSSDVIISSLLQELT